MKRRVLSQMLFLGLLLSSASQAVLVTYTASDGRSASADFALANGGDQLVIVLTNTTNVSGLAAGLNGSADIILSSINIDLSPVLITGGNVTITNGSMAVASTSTDAFEAFDEAFNLNDEYGYSSVGIGNAGTGLIIGALNAVTSHSNGGNDVTTFAGLVGGVGNGLDWGLVPNGSHDIGNGRQFVQNSVTIVLFLSETLTSLDFLDRGSYVEFGSDSLFVPNDEVIPEPATIGLIALSLGTLGLLRRRKA